jgi:hypothetical protein
MNRTLIIAGIIAIVASVLLVLSGLPNPNTAGFAIHLTEGNISPEQMPALRQADIEETPVISLDDIITYNSQTHELKLTTSAYEDISGLEVPVSGRSFVVCVDGEPIYWGAFWTSISSISFDGVVILKPLNSQGAKVITLELGYPSPSFFDGEDPRNDPEVIKSFEIAGKLITKHTIEEIDELPDSMKGYELYSWHQDGEWHFTLITGTNRNKSMEEVTSDEDVISEAGWVQIHVAGVEAIKSVLGKLKEGEEVFWLAGLRGYTPDDGVDISLPDESIVDSVRDFAIDRGLDLMVDGSYSEP